MRGISGSTMPKPRRSMKTTKKTAKRAALFEGGTAGGSFIRVGYELHQPRRGQQERVLLVQAPDAVPTRVLCEEEHDHVGRGDGPEGHPRGPAPEPVPRPAAGVRPPHGPARQHLRREDEAHED